MSDDMSMGLPSSAGEHGVLRSMQEVAIYLAAEANPGQWSVPKRSLSMVFGTPMTRHS